MENGSLTVITGPGKGKTTSALGMALRAAGHGLKVCFIQFIKSSGRSGETTSLGRLNDLIDFHIMGNGFTWKSSDLEEDRKKALQAWLLAKQRIDSGRYFLVVLDEFTYPLQYGMIDLKDSLEALSSLPGGTHVVVTGRYAPQALMEMADMVSVIQAVKHPYHQGTPARKGLEF